MKPAIFILLLSLLQCCKNAPAPESDTITYIHSEDLKEISSFNSLDLIDSCTYIPLETSPEVLISAIENITVTDKHLLFTDRQNDSLYVFDWQGKFLNTVGTKGRGPGEYLSLQSYCVDATGDTVIIFDALKLSFYTIDNRFIRSVALDKHLHIQPATPPINAIYFAQPGKLLLQHNMVTGSKTFYSVYDYQRDLLTRTADFPFTFDLGTPDNFMSTGMLRAVRWENTLSCPVFYNDTIYRYTNDSLIPRFVVPAMANKTVSPKLIRQQDGKTSPEALPALVQSGLFIIRINETENYFFIQYNGSTPCLLIWNKIQHKGLLVPLSKAFPGSVFAPVAVSAYALLNDEKQYYDTQGNTYYHSPEKTAALKQQLSEEDNPVIVIYHLKSIEF